MVIYFEKTMERLNSGDERIIFRTTLSILNIGPMKWTKEWQEAEATRKDFNFVQILSEKLFTSESPSRSFRTQPNVLIPNDFFQYMYHIGCAIFYIPSKNSGLIPGEQNLRRERQTVFFTSVDLMNKEHRDPNKIDLEAPRLAQYTRRQRGRNIKTLCIGSISDLLNRKDQSSIKQDPTQSFLMKRSQLIVSRRLS